MSAARSKLRGERGLLVELIRAVCHIALRVGHVGLLLSLYTVGAPAVFAADSIWAKAGVLLPVGCEVSSDVQTVPSPDKSASVEVRCAGRNRKGEGVVARITRRNRPPTELKLEIEPGSSWRPQEIVWAPDSSAFVVNGSESAAAGNDFVVYRIDGERISSTRMSAAAQRDMVATYPPCKASGLDRDACQRVATSAEFNVSAIAWTRGSRRLVVFAEVPCSSSYGGIMCQVMGYELDAPTGRILVRMTALEFKRRYQSEMAWPMRIPEKPLYK
jgi:hypothetical protein